MSFIQGTMLRRLNKPFRIRATLWLVAVYAVCVLAPHAALAFGNGAAHCLADFSPAAHVHRTQLDTGTHRHTDGAVHRHGATPSHDDAGNTPAHHPSDDSKNRAANCCGLFCIPAIALEPGVSFSPPRNVAAAHPGGDDAVNGLPPGRLNRPPIA